MPTLRTAPRCLVIATLLAAAPLAVPVEADDGRGRSGFYVGGHVGYIFGNGHATLGDPIGVAAAGGIAPFGSFLGGVQAGHDHFFPPRLVLRIATAPSVPGHPCPAQVPSLPPPCTGPLP